MFEKYVIVDSSLRNTPTGPAVDLRIPYYRGLGLSMIEKIELTLDGAIVAPTTIRFGIHDHEYPLAELPEQTEERWGFRETATLTIAGQPPLGSGPHQVHIAITLRISYMPVLSQTTATSEQTI